MERSKYLRSISRWGRIQLILDELPHNARHFVAVDLDDGIFDLDFSPCHYPNIIAAGLILRFPPDDSIIRNACGWARRYYPSALPAETVEPERVALAAQIVAEAGEPGLIELPEQALAVPREPEPVGVLERPAGRVPVVAEAAEPEQEQVAASLRPSSSRPSSVRALCRRGASRYSSTAFWPATGSLKSHRWSMTPSMIIE